MAVKLWSALACGLCVVSAPAWSELELKGFATIAGGMTLSDDASLYGYDDKGLMFNEESLFALQASSDLGSGLKATAQIKSAGANDWETTFEWAYLSYEFNENFKLLFGRQRQPFYMYSDYLDVGYAYHWITPPQGVYNLPFDSVDGLGLIYTDSWGELDSTVQVNTGRTQTTLQVAGGEYPVDVYKNMSANWSVVYRWLTLRAGYTRAKLDMPIAGIEALADGWSGLSAGAMLASAGFADADLPVLAQAMSDLSMQAANIAEGIRYQRDDVSFSDLGFIIDHNRFLVVGEITRLDLDDGAFGISDSGYLSVGYRITEKLMPHLTWGKDRDKAPNELIANLPQNPSGGLAPDIDGGLATLVAATAGTFGNFEFDSTYSIVGLRWDFHDSAAMKVELINRRVEDADEVNDSVNLLRFAVSTVF